MIIASEAWKAVILRLVYLLIQAHHQTWLCMIKISRRKLCSVRQPIKRTQTLGDPWISCLYRVIVIFVWGDKKFSVVLFTRKVTNMFMESPKW